MAETFSAFFNTKSGTLELSESALRIRGEKNLEVSLTHVVSFELLGPAPMGKVRVQLGYYDAFGNAESLPFAMREQEFHALKKRLGK